MGENEASNKIFYILGSILIVIIIAVAVSLYITKTQNSYKLILKGFASSSVEYGSDYEDPFVLATIGKKDASDKVIVEGKVDTYKPGEYIIKYTLGPKSVIRKVQVLELKESSADITGNANIAVIYTISSLELTNENIEVSFEIEGSQYSETVFKEESITNRRFSKKIEENGEYEFTFYDKDNKTKTLKLDINNIDKEPPTATCVLKNANGVSKITVDAKDPAGIESYKYNDQVYSEGSIEIKKEDNDGKLLLSVKDLVVTDKAGNEKNISCELKTDGLILIGDSRFEGTVSHLKAAKIDYTARGVTYVAKSGEYYTWFIKTAIGKVNEILKANPDKSYTILNNLGVNALDTYYNKTDYFDKMNELMDGDWNGNKVGYISVNPWNSSKNPKIEEFNKLAQKTMKSGLYCDTYTPLTCHKSGDLHYSSSCNIEIYNYIVDKCWF